MGSSRRALGVTALLAALVALLAAGAFAASPVTPRGGLPGPGSSEQAVAVAYLDPDIVLSLDVVSGRLLWSSSAVGFSPRGGAWNRQRPDHPYYAGVVGIYDPLDHSLYEYRGGIAGFAPAPARDAPAALSSPGGLPVWDEPSLVRIRGRLAGLRLPDGRRVGLRTDAAGRISQVRWPGPHGEPLRTTIAYRGSLTEITDPFGVRRVYEHSGAGRAFEIVPAAWRRGPGYRHWIAPFLDGAREIGWVQYRTTSRPPHRRVLISGLRRYAGLGFAGVSFDSPANGGYIDLGTASLARARALEHEMLRRGLLDVAAIMPTFSSTAQIWRADAHLRPVLAPMVRDCHVSWGEGAGPILITVSTTLTAAERSALDEAVRGVNAWVVINVSGRSECLSLRSDRG